MLNVREPVVAEPIAKTMSADTQRYSVQYLLRRGLTAEDGRVFQEMDKEERASWTAWAMAQVQDMPVPERGYVDPDRPFVAKVYTEAEVAEGMASIRKSLTSRASVQYLLQRGLIYDDFATYRMIVGFEQEYDDAISHGKAPRNVDCSNLL